VNFTVDRGLVYCLVHASSDATSATADYEIHNDDGSLVYQQSGLAECKRLSGSGYTSVSSMYYTIFQWQSGTSPFSDSFSVRLASNLSTFPERQCAVDGTLPFPSILDVARGFDISGTGHDLVHLVAGQNIIINVTNHPMFVFIPVINGFSVTIQESNGSVVETFYSAATFFGVYFSTRESLDSRILVCPMISAAFQYLAVWIHDVDGRSGAVVRISRFFETRIFVLSTYRTASRQSSPIISRTAILISWLISCLVLRLSRSFVALALILIYPITTLFINGIMMITPTPRQCRLCFLQTDRRCLGGE
jgi:hypothetical protein